MHFERIYINPYLIRTFMTQWIVTNMEKQFCPIKQKPLQNIVLKELRNCILCIIRVWSLFCSARVHVSLHFLPILLVKLGFRLFVFWFFVLLYFWYLIFTFSVPCIGLNVILKDLITFV